jgi:hypothetical protein
MRHGIIRNSIRAGGQRPRGFSGARGQTAFRAARFSASVFSFSGFT